MTSRKDLAGGALLFLLLAIASLGAIRSYDYPWHLASGRWITEHNALPKTDPFTVGSDAEEWHNGEWLFQVAAYRIVDAFGHEGIVVSRALLVATIFIIGFVVARRHVDPSLAFFLTAICWYGARERLDARPATLAALFVAIAIALLLSWNGTARARLVLYAILTVVWINTHPSAILAPALAAICTAGFLTAGGERQKERLKDGIALASVSAGALLLNPHGIEGILAPVRLIRLIGEGHFVNAEWLPSMPGLFPLLYITMLAGAILFVTRPKDRGHMAHAFLFVLLSWMAARYVRNQGLYFASYPLLMAPLLATTIRRSVRIALAACAALLLISVAVAARISPPLDPGIYPLRAVAELKKLGLAGNIYNPDQFGGYISWTFYPERRALIDGRNELHDTVMREYGAARLDGRMWEALIRKYDLTLAVDEYHRESMNTVDAVTGETRSVPASLIYFPRNRWALIAFDDVAMVFARRDSHPPELLEKIELRHLVPDDPDAISRLAPEQRSEAARELSRSIARFGSGERTKMLIDALSGRGL